jgi:hypothetical protein
MLMMDNRTKQSSRYFHVSAWYNLTTTELLKSSVTSYQRCEPEHQKKETILFFRHAKSKGAMPPYVASKRYHLQKTKSFWVLTISEVLNANVPSNNGFHRLAEAISHHIAFLYSWIKDGERTKPPKVWLQTA